MKTRLLVTALAVAVLTGGITVQAAPAHKMSQAEMTEMCQSMDAEGCRMMMREMVKRPELHKPMAEELMKNQDFETTWQKLHRHQSAHGG